MFTQRHTLPTLSCKVSALFCTLSVSYEAFLSFAPVQLLAAYQNRSWTNRLICNNSCLVWQAFHKNVRYGGLSTRTRAMSSAERVLSAFNFLTGEATLTAVTKAPLRCLLLTTLMKVIVMTKAMMKVTTGIKVIIIKIKLTLKDVYKTYCRSATVSSML